MADDSSWGQVEYLKKALKRGRLAHAYLFYGPEGAGKFAAAKSFAFSLSNAEVVILDTTNTLVSKKEKRKGIPIEDIRELKRRLSYAPREGVWRAVIINEAERFSQEAADAFLKILEEPGEKTLFILVSSAKDLLPQTIVSRTVPLRFFRSGRQILVASEKDPLFGKLRASLKEGNVYELLRLSSEVEEDAALRSKVLFYFMVILREELLSGGKDARGIIEKIKFANRASELLETTNVNPRLVLDTLLLA